MAKDTSKLPVPNFKILKAALAEYADARAYLVWRAFSTENETKFSKLPVDPDTGLATKPNTAKARGVLTFDEAQEAVEVLIDQGLPVGIGLYPPAAGLIALDADAYVKAGTLDDWVKPIIGTAYAEVSPSGTGIRMLVSSVSESLSALANGHERHNLGLYGAPTSKFVTLTGSLVDVSDPRPIKPLSGSSEKAIWAHWAKMDAEKGRPSMAKFASMYPAGRDGMHLALEDIISGASLPPATVAFAARAVNYVSTTEVEDALHEAFHASEVKDTARWHKRYPKSIEGALEWVRARDLGAGSALREMPTQVVQGAKDFMKGHLARKAGEKPDTAPEAAPRPKREDVIHWYRHIGGSGGEYTSYVLTKEHEAISAWLKNPDWLEGLDDDEVDKVRLDHCEKFGLDRPQGLDPDPDAVAIWYAPVGGGLDYSKSVSLSEYNAIVAWLEFPGWHEDVDDDGIDQIRYDYHVEHGLNIPSDLSKVAEGMAAFEAELEAERMATEAFDKSGWGPQRRPKTGIDRLVGAIIAKGILTVIAGSGGAAKSTLCASIAMGMARGHAVIGPEVLKVCNVLYLGIEDDLAMNERMLFAAAQRHRVASIQGDLRLFGEDNFRHVMKIHDGPLSLISDDAIVESFRDKLTDLISAANCDAVFIDPMAVLYGGQEMNNAAMNLLARELKRIAQVLNVAIVVVSHTRKPSGQRSQSQHDVKFGTELVDTARCVVNVGDLPQAEYDDLLNLVPAHEAAMVRKARVTKTNIGPGGSGFTFKISGESVECLDGSEESVGVVTPWTRPDVDQLIDPELWERIKTELECQFVLYSAQASGKKLKDLIAEIGGDYADNAPNIAKHLISEKWVVEREEKNPATSSRHLVKRAVVGRVPGLSAGYA
ncbi:AAA family ATPase [Shimia abyssi]|uniref:AAA domain-containing protein n=1 Tax=Shimia abyssi TaxID=1662395 RepID=A0A2P8FB78_9RHOB|nr:AAA family ATPase [Shimia abyssi]PSL18986.1 AAA domain-containing protein [Shimia abyssi]